MAGERTGGGDGGADRTDAPGGASGDASGDGLGGRLRRDLGRLESYAALIGVLVGAGIFRVTRDATAVTGPSVVLGYVVLAPAIFATSIAYVVFLSTPLGRLPGGEYTHLARTFGSPRLAFLGAWLKLISYVGASAFLATAMAGYLLELGGLLGIEADGATWERPLAVLGLAFFWLVHLSGVRWFGLLQVWMCVALGLSVVVLVVPGLFAIELATYRPFFTGGFRGFAASLAPLFFAYAGFESLAHTAGEVKDSTRELPRVFLRGIAVATAIFIAMSAVALGVVPAARLQLSSAPMAEAASVYLPVGAAAFVTLGGVFAVATSLNATMFVPARLALMLVHDGLLPRWLGVVHADRRTPTTGLTLTFALAAVLVLSGQVPLALGIAVLALVVLYGLHSSALLLLPRLNPELFAQVTVRIPRRVQVAAGALSVAAMVALVGVIVSGDLTKMRAAAWGERWRGEGPTSVELFALWTVIGWTLYQLGPARRRRGDVPEAGGE